MLGFLLRRLGASLLLLLFVLTVTFFLLRLVPGDPTRLSEDSRISLEQQQNLKRIYGLDRPLPEQYLLWLRAVVLHGDWGISFSQQRPVSAVIAEAIPATLLLAATALLVEYGVGFLLGVAAARRQGTAVDHLIRIGSLLIFSQPIFWFGLMAILLFSYVWPLFPAGHMYSIGAQEMGGGARFLDLLYHLVLPAAVLGLWSTGATARFVRGSLLDAMGRDYIRTARAKGLPERRVVWVHGMRNALTPVIQLFAMQLPTLLNGSLITEVIFSWPGLGRLIFTSILTRDYPVVLATTAMSAIFVLLGNLLGDLLQAVSDPTLRTVSDPAVRDA
ncbi:MAG TPA: ABC transporter permease [Thermoanaerobaculia bacterium]|nr:ABC transporter permease [Thermoanaerobaculia bacterium]